MSAASLSCVSVGALIDGRFPLLQELGGTERTSAYLTELDYGRAQRAAIKIFPFHSVDPTATTARWDVARTVSHPHLMPLLEAGRCELDGEDLLYVVTEYADETLSQILPERPLSPQEAREMLGPVLDALSYLHQHSLTHGHLRPTNIMVVDDRLKLSPDFGWCSGTPDIYDPPETRSGRVTPAADIWSLGVLLVEALTQKRPVWRRSEREPEIPAAIPEPFLTICRECLQTNPERRCTLAQIQARLNPPPPPEPADQPLEPITQEAASESHRVSAIITAGVILVLLLLAAAFKFGWDLTPSAPWSTAQTSPPHASTTPAPPANPAASGAK